MNLFIIYFGKLFAFLSQALNLGNGSTWPGHIALNLNKNFLKDTLKNSDTKVILIAGTNGKTTTSKLIRTILKENGKSFLHNKSGANLLNGLASSIIFSSNTLGKIKQEYAIFEIDENSLPKILEQVIPDYLICLDLFRDQLDRYGELDSIAKKWREAIKKLPKETKLILNADDPLISYVGNKLEVTSLYFGLNEKGGSDLKHGADTIYCPNCGNKLMFEKVYFSHLGVWSCPKCKLKREKLSISDFEYYPLPGTYNKYNVLAAVLLGKAEGFTDQQITASLKQFKPAFGRAEAVSYKGKNVQIFLSKNPTSFNESLETIKNLNGKNILVILNDLIPDGLDVSWIWDINFEDIINKEFNVAVSGLRAYDMAIRLKYAKIFTHVETDLKKAIDSMIENLESDETLYILPNYSAMLEARKILTGKKIL